MKRTDFTIALLLAPWLIRPAPGAAGARDLTPVISGRPWLNGRVGAAGLRGRVALVDVFTFDCINCTRITGNLRSLRRSISASDLVIIGVHTPEVPSYQGSLGYLAGQIRDNNITWPVVVDNDYRIWSSYDVGAWPTQLIFDRAGKLRKTVVGDSQDALVNATITQLLHEGA